MLAVAALAALATPAAASAETLWVAQTTTVPGNGRSCTSPGFNSIQAAIEKSLLGATIDVCAGTYTEQLQIGHPLSIKTSGSVTVALPATPSNSSTACDKASGTEAFQPDQELVAVCEAGVVKISGVTFEAFWPPVTCDESLYGILVAGASELKLSGSTLLGAGAKPINGCQGGVGIQVGMAWTSPVEVGKATLTNVSISGYQKNGVTVDGAGSKATIVSATVTGAGATPEIAQNGIQVSNGASAKITKSNIAGNECDNATCGESPFAFQSTGVLFFDAAAGSSVSESTIDENDIGVFYEAGVPAPTKPQTSIVANTLTNDRYESILLSQGWALVKNDVMSGGNVGICLLQFNDPEHPSFGESYGPKGTATGDTISGMKKWAVLGATNIAGTTKKEKEEQKALAGAIKVTTSKISGNPEGASVSESVHSESPTLAIFTDSSDS